MSVNIGKYMDDFSAKIQTSRDRDMLHVYLKLHCVGIHLFSHVKSKIDARMLFLFK